MRAQTQAAILFQVTRDCLRSRPSPRTLHTEKMAATTTGGEQSQENSMLTDSPVPVSQSALLAHRAAAAAVSDSQDAGPSTELPRSIMKMARFAPDAYHGSSPRKYSLSGLDSRHNSAFAPKPPGMARLPTRVPSAIATGLVNKPTTYATSLTPPSPSLNRSRQVGVNYDTFSTSMSTYSLDFGSTIGQGQQSSSLPLLMGTTQGITPAFSSA